MSNTRVSLSDRINVATSEKEVQVLLSEGAKYEFASGKTRRKWKRDATARVAVLNAKPDTNKAPLAKANQPEGVWLTVKGKNTNSNPKSKARR